jgi:hypothetical protein
MPRYHEDEISTDRLDALERRTQVLHQAAPAGSSGMPIDDIMAELRAIRDTQVEIKIQLTKGDARFQAIEAWQARHDDSERQGKTDLKALLFPAIGQVIWLLIAGGIGYLAAHAKP